MPKSPKRCEELRAEMRSKIIRESILYFAKNGFSGTKISDLSKYIGIGQGTIYLYFKSKEELFLEIQRLTNREKDINQIKMLVALPISAKKKVHKLTTSVLARLEQEESFAAMIAINTQMVLEQENHSVEGSIYQRKLYEYTARIIEQGQKEGTVVPGNPIKLADYYWGVVYLYALKKLFTTKYEMITAEDLERIILR